MAESSSTIPTLAPPAEAIHLPEPSYLPVVLAFGDRWSRSWASSLGWS